MKQDELVVGALIFLFGALTSILSLGLKIGTLSQIGTGFFPFALGILLMILASIYLVQIVLPSRKAALEEKTQGPPEAALAAVGEKTSIFSKVERPTVNVIVLAGSMLFFGLFLNTLGYPLCTFLMLVVLLRVLGLKNWPVVLTIAVISAAGSWLLFAQLLKIPLPQGFIGL
jgi:hypothetical protein